MTIAAFDLLTDAFSRGTCLQLVLSQRRAGTNEEFSKIVVRPVTIGGRSLWQFTLHFPRRVTHENHDAAAGSRRTEDLLRNVFEQGVLCTAEADYAIRARPDGSFRVSKSPPTKSVAAAAHDRGKA